jgi:hypothetical protein
MFIRYLTFILSFLFMSICNASLVEVDIFNDGSDKGFATETGQLVWMDLDVNNNFSFNEVLAMTNAQGVYAGWRLPTETEVWNLWQDTFCSISLQSSCEFSSSFYAYLIDTDSLLVREQWNILIDIMGHLQRYYDFEEYGARGGRGYYENGNGYLTSVDYDYGVVLSNDIAHASNQRREVICTPGDTACTPRDVRQNVSPNFSTLLVRPSTQIPEPNTHIWFMIALIIFIKTYRKA